MYCMKSKQIGHGTAVLTSPADSAQFWRIGQNWPFHALLTSISCNTFLESLKHADQPWVVLLLGHDFVLNFILAHCVEPFDLKTTETHSASLETP